MYVLMYTAQHTHTHGKVGSKLKLPKSSPLVMENVRSVRSSPSSSVTTRVATIVPVGYGEQDQDHDQSRTCICIKTREIK